MEPQYMEMWVQASKGGYFHPRLATQLSNGGKRRSL